MPTKLTKEVVRESSVVPAKNNEKQVPLFVSITPTGVVLRLKGHRKSYVVEFEKLWDFAHSQEAATVETTVASQVE